MYLYMSSEVEETSTGKSYLIATVFFFLQSVLIFDECLFRSFLCCTCQYPATLSINQCAKLKEQKLVRVNFNLYPPNCCQLQDKSSKQHAFQSDVLSASLLNIFKVGRFLSIINDLKDACVDYFLELIATRLISSYGNEKLASI